MKLSIWHILFGLLLLVGVGFEFVTDSAAGDAIWYEVFFFGIWGFLGCLFLSLLAKGIVSPGLDRPEDYYTPEEASHDWFTQSPVNPSTKGEG